MKGKFLILLTLIAIGYLGVVYQKSTQSASKSPNGIVGSIFLLKVDFTIYRVLRKEAEGFTPYYLIKPAPEVGMGGRDLTEMGRMPKGTKVEIVKVTKNKYYRTIQYWVKPVGTFNEELSNKTFRISSLNASNKLYEKEKYSNTLPKLTDTWFDLIHLNE